MKNMKAIAGLLALLFIFTNTATAQGSSCAEWLDVEVSKLHSSETIDLCAETAGKPLLLVNTASYCGFTYQFTGLEALNQKYKDQGLVVIGFPSDDFNQEDDDASATAEVCYVNHGVTFLMSETIDVKNDDAHPVFAHLGGQTEAPGWNFNKYLVNSQGEVVEHFGRAVEPDSDEMESAIEALL